MFLAKINYLNHCKVNSHHFHTINTSKLDELLDANILQSTNQIIYPIQSTPCLFSNGFELYSLSSTTQKILKTLDCQILENGFDKKAFQLSIQLQQHIESILETHFHHEYNIVCVDAVCRNTDPNTNSAFRQITLAHTDFSKSHFKNTMKCFVKQWKPHFDRKKLSYNLDDFHEMINIWMPLNHVSAFPLALYDCKFPHKITPYNGVRRDGSIFVAQCMVSSQSVQNGWRYVPEMKFGTGIIFQSMKTPHCAFDIGGENRTRRSCECRCLLFRKNKKTPETSLIKK